jgi:hypothetical protein
MQKLIRFLFHIVTYFRSIRKVNSAHNRNILVQEHVRNAFVYSSKKYNTVFIVRNAECFLLGKYLQIFGLILRCIILLEKLTKAQLVKKFRKVIFLSSSNFVL